MEQIMDSLKDPKVRERMQQELSDAELEDRKLEEERKHARHALGKKQIRKSQQKGSQPFIVRQTKVNAAVRYACIGMGRR